MIYNDDLLLIISGAMITNSEQVGLGMVQDGSICAENKVSLKIQFLKNNDFN